MATLTLEKRPADVPDDYIFVRFAYSGCENDPADPDSWSDPDDVVIAEDAGGTVWLGDVWTCERSGDYYLYDDDRATVISPRRRDVVETLHVGEAESDSGLVELDSEEYGSQVYGNSYDNHVVEAWDTETYFFERDAYATHDGERYYSDEFSRDEYDAESAAEDGIHGYHGSPAPSPVLGADDSRYRVGFEVEKTSLTPEPSILWTGFEEDSSCGYEAITNILPLSTADDVSGPVFAAMSDASDVLGEPVDRSCGGHVTISDRDASSADLAARFRTRAGFVYAPWGFRLRNTYCGGESSDRHRMIAVLNREGTDKYSPVNVKSFGVEWRVPSAVANAGTLKARYLYFAAIVETFGMTWADAAEYMRPHMVRLYRGDEEKAATRLAEAAEWQAYVERDAVGPRVARVLSLTQRAGNAEPCRPDPVPMGWDRGMLRLAFRINEAISDRLRMSGGTMRAAATHVMYVAGMGRCLPSNPHLPRLVPEGWTHEHVDLAYACNTSASSALYRSRDASIPNATDRPIYAIPRGWEIADYCRAYRAHVRHVAGDTVERDALCAGIPGRPDRVPEGWTRDHMRHMNALRAHVAAYPSRSYADADLVSYIATGFPDRLRPYTPPADWSDDTFEHAYSVAALREAAALNAGIGEVATALEWQIRDHLAMIPAPAMIRRQVTPAVLCDA